MNDYEKALALSREQHKPLLIDFTGWACVNCRKMEETVWVEPEIRKLIEEKYVLVSLYVDENVALPAEEQVVSTTTGKRIRTVGKLWSDMQLKYFKANAQPWYVLVSPDEQLLSNALGTASAQTYENYLRCGLDAFEKHKANLSASAR
jgi:thiol:disulfide interchange protein DsbD